MLTQHYAITPPAPARPGQARAMIIARRAGRSFHAPGCIFRAVRGGGAARNTAAPRRAALQLHGHALCSAALQRGRARHPRSDGMAAPRIFIVREMHLDGAIRAAQFPIRSVGERRETCAAASRGTFEPRRCLSDETPHRFGARDSSTATEHFFPINDFR